MPRPDEVAFPSRKERFEDRRKEGEHRKLRDEFFDHATLLAISRLVTQGQFDTLDFPIATGKEGGVFRASSAAGFRAVKVYRIGNSVFRSLPPHVIEEFRRESSERNFARLVSAWTRREHTILRKMREADVAVPEPAAYLRNVLVMEFIGTDGVASPRLNDARSADPAALFDDLAVQVRRMVVGAGLVHGDLSPYNVLLHEERPVLIDVAQAIPAKHPQARDLLVRDLRNFAKFFARLGVVREFPDVWSAAGGTSLNPVEA
ncbi:MAG TPA: RIO1 family regulatory kinase/ATPase [Thermoplasmata archaeon]|nr:RIO1 family regulatory kinase/ATPase [Thermoplasmata archaeon]